ncbi:MAG TPA: (2Fe-2S) ferredoxin domain-containing protein [Lachnospiraceae bacterium]|nr:(2Fe-2S) ferredoxin domain-containing protein [Lachnospiraceae bacterium]
MKSLEELKAIREKMQGQLGLREEENAKTRVLVGMATCGIAAGARPVLNELADKVQSDHVKDVMVSQTGCIGLCQYEPIVEIYEPGKEKVTYVHMDKEKADRVVKEHLEGGKPIVEFMLHTVRANEAKNK